MCRLHCKCDYWTRCASALSVVRGRFKRIRSKNCVASCCLVSLLASTRRGISLIMDGCDNRMTSAGCTDMGVLTSSPILTLRGYCMGLLFITNNEAVSILRWFCNAERRQLRSPHTVADVPVCVRRLWMDTVDVLLATSDLTTRRLRPDVNNSSRDVWGMFLLSLG